MAQISLQIPQSGQPFSTEGPKVASDMTTIQTAINGNLDTTNLTAAVSQSAGVNTGGVIVKGAVSIATSESRTNVAYGTLTTPDQVTGIVLPSNGLLVVWYQALWQESVAGGASADLFLNGVQLLSPAVPGVVSAFASAPATINRASVNLNYVLGSYWAGLQSAQGAANTGNGGVASIPTTGVALGSPYNATITEFWAGGACYITAAAGTYTVSVQFKASSGSVTASNRTLRAMALSFA